MSISRQSSIASRRASFNKQASLSQAEEPEISSIPVKEFLQEYSEVKYVDKRIFYSCYHKIKPWIDISVLVGYLMKYNIVQSVDDMEELTSSYFKRQDRLNSLLRMVEKGGNDGYMLLYICLRESCVEAVGHNDVVAELNCGATQSSINPPWMQKTDRRGSSIDPDQTGNTKSTPTEVKLPIHKPKNSITNQISSLEQRFCNISSSTLEDFMEKELDVKLIRRHVLSLPLHLKREFANQIYENALKITNEKCMVKLFLYLDTTLWNFIDYALLEHIIEYHGSPAIQQEMKEYVSDLLNFKQKTTIEELIENWPGRKNIPPSYCSVSAKIDLNPKECTLHHLNKLRMKLTEKFLPPLSDFAMIHCNFSSGSIIVGWAIDLDLIPTFTNKICELESSSFFETNLIVSLSIRGIQVYPLSIHQASEPEGNETAIITGTIDTYYSLMQKSIELQLILSKPSNSLHASDFHDRLVHLSEYTQRLLKTKNIRLQRIIDSFPQEARRQYYSYLKERLMEGARPPPHHSEDYLVHLILLQVSIDTYGQREMSREMKMDIEEVLKLRATITAEDFIKGNSSPKPIPPTHEEIEMRIDKEIRYYNLKEIEDLRRGFIDEYTPKDSRALVYLSRIAAGSTILFLGAPKKEAKIMMEVILQDNSRNFFQEHNIDTVKVDDKLCYDYNSPYKILDCTLTSKIISTLQRQKPSISINNQGWLVQTYKHQRQSISYYRIGCIAEEEEGEDVDWRGKEHSYPSGKRSQISLNDQGLVVEAFESYRGKRCLYRVGQLDITEGLIRWIGDPVLFGSGERPSVAINNKGNVIATYETKHFPHPKNTFYMIGIVDDKNGSISWKRERKNLNNCSKASVSLNDHGVVQFSFTSKRFHSIMTGQINTDTCESILALSPIPAPRSGTNLNSDYSTSVGVNNFGHVIAAKVVKRNVQIFSGRQHHSEVAATRPLEKTDTKLLNTGFLVHDPSVTINDRNIAFTCHIAHGFMNHQKIVFTSLGKLTPRDSSLENLTPGDRDISS